MWILAKILYFNCGLMIIYASFSDLRIQYQSLPTIPTIYCSLHLTLFESAINSITDPTSSQNNGERHRTAVPLDVPGDDVFPGSGRLLDGCGGT